MSTLSAVEDYRKRRDTARAALHAITQSYALPADDKGRVESIVKLLAESLKTTDEALKQSYINAAVYLAGEISPSFSEEHKQNIVETIGAYLPNLQEAHRAAVAALDVTKNAPSVDDIATRVAALELASDPLALLKTPAGAERVRRAALADGAKEWLGFIYTKEGKVPDVSDQVRWCALAAQGGAPPARTGRALRL